MLIININGPVHPFSSIFLISNLRLSRVPKYSRISFKVSLKTLVLVAAISLPALVSVCLPSLILSLVWCSANNSSSVYLSWPFSLATISWLLECVSSNSSCTTVSSSIVFSVLASYSDSSDLVALSWIVVEVLLPLGFNSWFQVRWLSFQIPWTFFWTRCVPSGLVRLRVRSNSWSICSFPKSNRAYLLFIDFAGECFVFAFKGFDVFLEVVDDHTALFVEFVVEFVEFFAFCQFTLIEWFIVSHIVI